jgi:hypothetical protein
VNLRSRIIRLAHTQPELRPHLLPLLKESASDDLDDELSPEENAVLLWERKYRTRQEALLRVWESEYDRRLESLGDDLLSDLESLKKLVRFWFWERKGNYLETPVEEAPDFEGARGAMFHRRRKALADVKAVADRMAARLSSVGLFGDDFLNGLYRELDQYERSFDSL